jgi:hypothetical protein
MFNRNSRQCKDRWEYYLSPKVDLSLWTKEEDNLLIQKRKEYGAHWMKIHAFFPKRTDTALKNRWTFLHKQIQKNHQELTHHNSNFIPPTSHIQLASKPPQLDLVFNDQTENDPPSSIDNSELLFDQQQNDFLSKHRFDFFDEFPFNFVDSFEDAFFP